MFFRRDISSLDSPLKAENSISFNGGKSWHEYRQYEPISTILSTFVDLKNLHTRTMNQRQFVSQEEMEGLYSDVSKELMMVTANNIANKTFAQNLSDQLDVIFQTKNLSDWAGNTLSGVVPWSGMAKSAGRFFGDGIKYEPKTFTERVFKAYKFVLDRPSLDSFGMEEKDVEYNYLLGKKVDTSHPKFEARREMVRLGIPLEWKVPLISCSNI